MRPGRSRKKRVAVAGAHAGFPFRDPETAYSLTLAAFESNSTPWMAMFAAAKGRHLLNAQLPRSQQMIDGRR